MGVTFLFSFLSSATMKKGKNLSMVWKRKSRTLGSGSRTSVIRSVHQDAAKTAAVDALSETDVLLIMDWAMKFLPASYRETQRDWYGKKGKPWHITVAITKADNEEIEVSLMLQSCLSYSLPSFSKRHKTRC